MHKIFYSHIVHLLCPKKLGVGQCAPKIKKKKKKKKKAKNDLLLYRSMLWSSQVMDGGTKSGTLVHACLNVLKPSYLDVYPKVPLFIF